MAHDCGKCRYFLKTKLEDCSGLCEWHDCRTYGDRGHRCEHFKRKKYDRKKKELIEPSSTQNHIVVKI